MRIENEIPNPDRDQLREERQARLESKFIGSLRPKPGQRCYKYNFVTGKLFELDDDDYYDSEAKVVEPFKVYTKPEGMQIGNFVKQKKKVKKPPVIKKSLRVRVEPHTYYFCALNADSAIKFVNKKLFR